MRIPIEQPVFSFGFPQSLAEFGVDPRYIQLLQAVTLWDSPKKNEIIFSAQKGQVTKKWITSQDTSFVALHAYS